MKFPDSPLTPEKLQEIRDRQDRKFGHREFHGALLLQQDRKNLLAHVAWQEFVLKAHGNELVRLRRSLGDP